MKNPKRILPDGTPDYAADFEDDGASFRLRREAQLRRMYPPSAKAQIMGGIYLWWRIVKVVGAFFAIYAVILTVLAVLNIIH